MLIVSRLILKLAVGMLIMAYITLAERGILSRIQLRVGPQRVGPWGLLQPISDAVKLLLKSTLLPSKTNIAYLLIPPMFLMLSLFGFWVLPTHRSYFYIYYNVIVLLLLSALSVYPVLFSGWSSNSKWGVIGAVRGIAQTISYEVRIAFIIISMLVFYHSISIHDFDTYLVGIILPVRIVIWLLRVLAELNRTPFDLAEGESELVSGYNTEYSGSLFTILFMAEYIFILVISIFSAYMLFRRYYMTILLILYILWRRATLPRMRVDALMRLCWHIVLPLSITSLLLGAVTSSIGGVAARGPDLSFSPLTF